WLFLLYKKGNMHVVIEDEYLVKLVNGVRQKPKYPNSVEHKFVIRINQIRAAENENYLRGIKSLHFEKLSCDRLGKYSIRVLDGWRIIFRIDKEEIKILIIEELSNHYK